MDDIQKKLNKAAKRMLDNVHAFTLSTGYKDQFKAGKWDLIEKMTGWKPEGIGDDLHK